MVTNIRFLCGYYGLIFCLKNVPQDDWTNLEKYV